MITSYIWTQTVKGACADMFKSNNSFKGNLFPLLFITKFSGLPSSKDIFFPYVCFCDTQSLGYQDVLQLVGAWKYLQITIYLLSCSIQFKWKICTYIHILWRKKYTYHKKKVQFFIFYMFPSLFLLTIL